MKKMIMIIALFSFSVSLAFAFEADKFQSKTFSQLAVSLEYAGAPLYLPLKPFDKQTAGVISMTTNETMQNDLCSCVIWLRKNRVSNLPYNLNTAQDKINIINFSFPVVGSVGIARTSAPEWHVFYISNVKLLPDGRTYLYIEEANFKSCAYSKREGTPEQLGVVGYFNPKFPTSFAYPQVTGISTNVVSAGQQNFLTISGKNFDPSTIQVMVFGGNYCNSWGKCVVGNNALSNKTANSVTVPITLNNKYPVQIHAYNSSSGAISNGISVDVK